MYFYGKSLQSPLFSSSIENVFPSISLIFKNGIDGISRYLFIVFPLSLIAAVLSKAVMCICWYILNK